MKNIYLIIGKSGIGKTTVSEYLHKKYNFKTVASYTTRPKRYDGEEGHIFVTKEEFDKLPLLAYTKFNNYEYGATAELIQKADIYVIDIDGLKELTTNLKDKKCVTIYLKANILQLIFRMFHRGDSLKRVIERIKHDKIAFKEVHRIKFNHYVNANKSLKKVTEDIYNFIKTQETN